VRIGLALVGTINILLTAWFLSDARPSFLEPVGEHAGRELGAFSAMLAAAYLLSALDGRARARLGPVSIGIGILVVTAFTDLISSQTHVLYEVANHLPNVVGFALLWSLARSEPSMGAPRPTMRHERDEGMEEAA